MPSRIPELHVLIIGAGIGGLALAQGLKKHGISFHVYERDATHDHRSQGYRIRVAQKGTDAIRYLVPDELFELFNIGSAETRSGPMTEIDASSAEVSTIHDDPLTVYTESKPHNMDRTVLRSILLRGLEDHITYGKKFDRYEEDGSGIRAYFSDKGFAHGTLLVGADGSKSAVRRQMLGKQELLDTGSRCIYGKTAITPALVDSLEPAIMWRMAKTKHRDGEEQLLSMMVTEPITFPNRQEMQAQGVKCPNDYIYWVLISQPSPVVLPNEIARVRRLSYEDCAELALKATKEWHPTLRTIVEHQNPGETSLIPVLSSSPSIPVWNSRKDVTFVGDAIHVMTPAAGFGAVTALRDAFHLCLGLVDEGQSAGMIQRYEASMRVYAAEAIEASVVAGQEILKPFEEWEVAEPRT